MPRSPHLPDEMIKEFLAPLLHISDERFANNSERRSPFATYNRSTSELLLVCKTWQRVGTPELYNTVVLRSKAQAHALAFTLQKYPQLGRFIKKLRIEGGYGEWIGKILKRSPNVQDLWVTTRLQDMDSVHTYLEGFRSINPRRLILQEICGRSTNRAKLREALASAMRKNWTELSVVTLSTGTFGFSYPITVRQQLEVIVDGLLVSKIRSLKLETSAYPLDDAVIANCLYDLMALPTLQVIQFTTNRTKLPFEHLLSSTVASNVSQSNRSIDQVMTMNRKIYNKMQFVRIDSEGVQIPRSANYRYQPMSNASDEDKEFIWGRILQGAIEDPGTNDRLAFHYGQGYEAKYRAWKMQKFKVQLARVSKTFLNIVLPLLYRGPIVQTVAAAQKLATSPHTHFIKILCLDVLDHNVCYNPAHLTATSAIESLIANCSNLAVISASRFVWGNNANMSPDLSVELWNGWREPQLSTLPYSILNSIAKHSGNTLSQLYIPAAPLRGSDKDLRSAFSSITALTRLRSLAIGGYDESPILSLRVASLPPGTLSTLESLAVGTQDTIFSSKLLAGLAKVELPCIRRLELSDNVISKAAKTFLKSHGKKLTTLRAIPGLRDLFILCPNVTHWSIARATEFDFPCLSSLPDDNDVALTTIITADYYDFGYEELERLIDTDLSRLKHLREIIFAKVAWPNNEYEIKECRKWPVSLADAIVQKWPHIVPRDREGRAWRPRLKYKSRGF